jgi:hypothetical protein
MYARLHQETSLRMKPFADKTGRRILLSLSRSLSALLLVVKIPSMQHYRILGLGRPSLLLRLDKVDRVSPGARSHLCTSVYVGLLLRA